MSSIEDEKISMRPYLKTINLIVCLGFFFYSAMISFTYMDDLIQSFGNTWFHKYPVPFKWFNETILLNEVADRIRYFLFLFAYIVARMVFNMVFCIIMLLIFKYIVVNILRMDTMKFQQLTSFKLKPLNLFNDDKPDKSVTALNIVDMFLGFIYTFKENGFIMLKLMGSMSIMTVIFAVFSGRMFGSPERIKIQTQLYLTMVVPTMCFLLGLYSIHDKLYKV
jgi:hypothetical protein